jgi:hypothetical protein
MTMTLEGPAGYLTVQFLTWVSEAPRTYGDAMDAWRTSCPRLSIWDDAVRDGLIRVENGRGSMRQSLVLLTDRGRIVLKQRSGATLSPR